MRVCVILLLVSLAMAFVATYGADEEEAGGADLSVNEESDEAADSGDRVKRRRPKFKWPCPPPLGAKGMKKGKCICYFWGNVHCHIKPWGCYCHSPKGKSGGCQVIWKGGSSSSAGPHGGNCRCNTKKGLKSHYH